MINMDSQIPNKAALEWIKAGHLFPEKVQVTPEKTYGDVYKRQSEQRV